MRQVSAFLQRHLPAMLGSLVLLTVVVVLWIFSAPIALWLRSIQSFDAVAFLGQHLLAVAILGGGLLIFVLIWLPKWQAARPELTPQARFEVENNARKTLAEVVGGAALLVGLYFTWANLQATQETATKDRETTREGQITERFTKAIDQLGHEKLQIRLGGIYALARIAGESEKDHWPIMEVLTAYVREHAPWPPQSPKNTPPPIVDFATLINRFSAPQDHPSPKGDPTAAEEPPLPKLATDIQAVLTVLAQRNRTYEKQEQRLDLRQTDLRKAQLRKAQLQGANLKGAILTVEQLSTVETVYQAHLDPPLLEQIQQQYPQLLKEPF
jgi:hypothetical protein